MRPLNFSTCVVRSRNTFFWVRPLGDCHLPFSHGCDWTNRVNKNSHMKQYVDIQKIAQHSRKGFLSIPILEMRSGPEVLSAQGSGQYWRAQTSRQTDVHLHIITEPR